MENNVKNKVDAQDGDTVDALKQKAKDLMTELVGSSDGDLHHDSAVPGSPSSALNDAMGFLSEWGQ